MPRVMFSAGEFLLNIIKKLCFSGTIHSKPQLIPVEPDYRKNSRFVLSIAATALLPCFTRKSFTLQFDFKEMYFAFSFSSYQSLTGMSRLELSVCSNSTSIVHTS
jgi:hypothetical protein